MSSARGTNSQHGNHGILVPFEDVLHKAGGSLLHLSDKTTRTRHAVSAYSSGLTETA